jgi:hypothetical protein
MPTLTLNTIPGFSDLPDNTLTQDTPALGIYLDRISDNASFGMVRMEIFFGLYHNGDTVGLPVSKFDGYTYELSELTFAWSIANSTNPTSGWITGPDSLWYGEWLVDQTTGAVSCVEAYRQSGTHANQQASNDGTLGVFTIAQRQKTTMVIATPLTAYTDLPDAGFVSDVPLNQGLLRQLNDNAKFAAINGECIFMGEFSDTQTVPRPVSPADGYTYTYAETLFTFSWRWTVNGSGFAQPDFSLGQLDRIAATVSSVGVVSTTVFYKGSGLPAQATGHGRISVFAWCSRSDLISSIPSLSNSFTEIDSETFMPGETLRASTVLQINKNIREAVCSPEFFPPANYHSGDTVPLPTSALDGYSYTRAEVAYIWDWAHTTPQTTGQHYRLPAFLASINSSTGVVTIQVWRLPPGGPYVAEPSGDSDDAIRVLVVGIRGASHPALPATTTTPPTGTTTTTVVDNGPADIQPYAIAFDIGAGSIPTASQSLYRHIIAGDLAGVAFASSLPASVFKSRAAATASYTITITKNGSSIGTLNFAIGATTATITFGSPVTAVSGDEIEFIGQVTPDATLAGIYGTMSGTRT